MARVQVEQGLIQGTKRDSNGVTAFLGVPYAAPPVGPLRFEPPRPPSSWQGVRVAGTFGDRCVQRRPFSDMVFRSCAMSEDCLYLNIWTRAAGLKNENLPILFYIHGGAFLVGDGSEPRYDGAAIAAEGIVVVTVNFRLGVFGFFAHPELAGTNAGLFDLAAALDWVRANATAFGGDPERITIAGSSTGSFAVCALMSSPYTKEKISGAMAHSGALLGTRLAGLGASLAGLEEARSRGSNFAASMEVANLEDLKAKVAIELLDQSSPLAWNRPFIDGQFLTQDLYALFKSGDVAHVPFLIGATSAERDFEPGSTNGPKTARELLASLEADYGEHAELVYRVYGSPKSEAEVRIAARDLASDRWIGVDTYRFAQAMVEQGASVFSYIFDKIRPEPKPNSGGWTSTEGAAHCTDIEYFLGTQELTDVYAWTEEDKALSARMQGYVVNFVKTGDPNGNGLCHWPSFCDGKRIVLSPNGGSESLASFVSRVDVLSDQQIHS